MPSSDEDFMPAEMAQRDPLLTSSRGGKAVPDATFDRWMYRGVRGVKLQTVMIGGRRAVSRAALKQFIDAVSAASVASTPNRNQIQNQRGARAARVVKTLERKRPRAVAPS